MNITTEFDVGQSVYAVTRERGQEWVPCRFCAETGQVKGVDGQSRLCPDCYGRRGTTGWLPRAWRTEASMTVGQVRVAVTCSSGREGEEMFDNFKAQAGWREEYMLVETGVGSGTIWKAEDLFGTCDERNAVAAT